MKKYTSEWFAMIGRKGANAMHAANTAEQESRAARHRNKIRWEKEHSKGKK